MKYIARLEDVSKLSDQVRIRKGDYLLVNALELDQLASLVFKHTALKEALSEYQNPEGEIVDQNGLFHAILAGGRELVRDLVDAATEIPGIGARLSAVEQGNVILACLNITVPSDKEEVADFLDQLVAFVRQATVMVQVAKAKGLQLPKPKRA